MDLSKDRFLIDSLHPFWYDKVQSENVDPINACLGHLSSTPSIDFVEFQAQKIRPKKIISEKSTAHVLYFPIQESFCFVHSFQMKVPPQLQCRSKVILYCPVERGLLSPHDLCQTKLPKEGLESCNHKNSIFKQKNYFDLSMQEKQQIYQTKPLSFFTPQNALAVNNPFNTYVTLTLNPFQLSSLKEEMMEHFLENIVFTYTVCVPQSKNLCFFHINNDF